MYDKDQHPDNCKFFKVPENSKATVGFTVGF